MNLNRLRTVLTAAAALISTTVQAQQVINLTPLSNLKTVLNSVRPGDTIQVTGTWEAALRITNRDFGGVKMDASGAVLREGLLMQNVHNIQINGGTYGRTDKDTFDLAAFRISNGSHVSLSNATILGNGNMTGAGVRVSQSQFITIRDNYLSGHRGSIVVYSSNDSLVTRNNMVNASSDGINIADSQRVIVSSNTCSNFTPGPAAHPDCIQLWSSSGRPLQSDIFVLNNSAIGNMQAFLSSDPKTGSGTRLTFGGNYAAVTYTHTVTCGNCTYSTFVDNVLANLPESNWGPGSLKIGTKDVGTSPTNIIGSNPLYDLRGRTDGWMPAPTWTSLVPDIAGVAGSQWDDRSFGFLSAANALGVSGSGVPEPASWLTLSLGFAAIGRQLRRRRSPRQVMA